MGVSPMRQAGVSPAVKRDSSMSIAELNFFSRTLGMQMAMNVVTPRGKGPFPVLYLLHGLGGDCTSLTRNVALENFIERRALMAVMPSAGKGYYCNLPGTLGADWEEYILRDVIRFIDGTFQTIAEPANRAVGGISMGGYGALMLAMRRPDVFSTAFSMSGSLYFAAMPHPKGEEYQEELAKLVEPGRYDLFQLAKQARQKQLLPAIRFDCGTEDFLVDCNRQFHRHLEELGVEHQYAEFPGAHDWDYWQARLAENLDFVMGRIR
jgi:S-formylglutathione hydrolase FrmB